MKNLKITLTLVITVFLLSCTNESLSDSDCDLAYSQRDQLADAIELLQEQYDDGEIAEETYQDQYNHLWNQVYALEEANPDCFF